MSKDTQKNGNGKDPERRRVGFKRGERERHLELLAKNSVAVRQLKAKLKKAQDAVELCIDDLEHGGYMAEAQTTMPGLGEDGSPEARS